MIANYRDEVIEFLTCTPRWRCPAGERCCPGCWRCTSTGLKPEVDKCWSFYLLIDLLVLLLRVQCYSGNFWVRFDKICDLLKFPFNLLSFAIWGMPLCTGSKNYNSTAVEMHVHCNEGIYKRHCVTCFRWTRFGIRCSRFRILYVLFCSSTFIVLL